MIDIRQLICNTAKALQADPPVREVRMRLAERDELVKQLDLPYITEPGQFDRFNGLPIVLDESAEPLPRKKTLQRSMHRR